MNSGNMSNFLHYLFKYFTVYIGEMKSPEYKIPVQIMKKYLHIQVQSIERGTYVEMPKAISGTKGVVTTKNIDNLCFLYSIVAIKHRVEKNLQHVLKTVRKVSQ